VEQSRDPAARGIDWPGQVTLPGGLFLLVLALLRGNEDGWTSAPILAEAAGAVALLGAFLVVETRSASPMLPLRLFRDRSFSGAQIAAFAISASFFAIFLYTTLYLQQILGLSAVEAGLVYLPRTITMLFVSGATSTLGAKVSARLMVAGGLALVSAGMVLLTLAGVGSSWTIVLPGAVVALVGTGFFNPALTAVALGTVPMEQSGVAAGVNDTFRQAGIAVGVAALGALIPAQAAFGGGTPQGVRRRPPRRAARRRGAGCGGRGRRLVPHLPAFGAAAPMPAEEQRDLGVPGGAEPALAPA
jgi:predicted MFS family arabinose efflux permease